MLQTSDILMLGSASEECSPGAVIGMGGITVSLWDIHDILLVDIMVRSHTDVKSKFFTQTRIISISVTDLFRLSPSC